VAHRLTRERPEGIRMKKKILISDIDGLEDLAGSLWIEQCTNALRRNKTFSAALSGGSTPIPFYRKLADMVDPELWISTHIFQVDERFVPRDHPDNNFRMIRRTLTDRAPIPAANLHPVPIAESPEESARLYESDLRKFFNPPPGKMPRFDLILLGIGADGHTASIFPGSGVVREKQHFTAAVILDEEKHHRITLTLPVLNRAALVLFLATGRAKSGVIKNILGELDAGMPASMVGSGDGPVVYLLDHEAASELPKETVEKYAS
jgi:6-phosphogluconolactonase